MTFRQKIAFWAVLMCSAVVSGAQGFGPVNTPILNHSYYYVGQSPFLYTIQSAVTAACNVGKGQVIIQPTANPTDAPAAQTGCANVTIRDQRNPSGDVCYVYATASTYTGSACGGGKGSSAIIDSSLYSTIDAAMGACNLVYCEIQLDTKLTQATSGILTIPTGIAITGAAGGGITPGTGNTLSFANSSFTGPDEPFFTGAGTITGLTGQVSVAWFGALADANTTTPGSGTDNTTAVQNAINATATGQVKWGPGVYRGCPYTITASNVGMIGAGSQATKLTCNSLTADIIDVNGASFGRFQHFWMQRTIHPTNMGLTGPAALSLVNTGAVFEDDLVQYDSPRGFYYNSAPGYGLGQYSNLNSTFGGGNVTYSTTDVIYAFTLDSRNGVAENSATFINGAAGAVGTAQQAIGVGYEVVGSQINDIDLEHPASAGLAYGTYISYTGSGQTVDSDTDLHFKNSTFDNCMITCVYIAGVTSDVPSPMISFDGGYLDTDNGGTLVKIVNGVNISFSHMQLFAPMGSGGKGFDIEGGTAIKMENNMFATFLNGAYGAKLSTCNQCIFTGNTFTNASSGPLAVGVEGVNGTVNSIIALNSFTDGVTAGITLDATSQSGNNVGMNSFASSVTTPYSGFTSQYSAFPNGLYAKFSIGPSVAPSGTCAVSGATIRSQDNVQSYCDPNTLTWAAGNCPLTGTPTLSTAGTQAGSGATIVFESGKPLTNCNFTVDVTKGSGAAAGLYFVVQFTNSAGTVTSEPNWTCSTNSETASSVAAGMYSSMGNLGGAPSNSAAVVNLSTVPTAIVGYSFRCGPS